MAQTRGSGGKTTPEPNFLMVARVLRAWGIRGDVKIQPFTDRPEDFKRFKHVYVGDHHQPCDVQSFRPYQGNWLLHLKGVESRDEAEALHGQSIWIEREQRVVEQGEFLIDQIIGLKVVTTSGEELGAVVEVIATGANDVYVVQGEREILLPARSEVVRDIDLERGVMVVELLEGL